MHFLKIMLHCVYLFIFWLSWATQFWFLLIKRRGRDVWFRIRSNTRIFGIVGRYLRVHENFYYWNFFLIIQLLNIQLLNRISNRFRYQHILSKIKKTIKIITKLLSAYSFTIKIISKIQHRSQNFNVFNI